MNFFDLYNLETTYGPAVWVISGILFFLCLENLIPFREATLSKFRRWRINFSLNFCNILIVDWIFITLIRKSELSFHGLMFNAYERLHFNAFGRIIVTVFLLDLAMYAWHRINHEIPFFWKFHQVHHTDLNVDVSSASRFHFGEVTISTVITYTLMFILGATIVEIRIFQVFLFLMAQFGHSNILLNGPFEKYLWYVIVPPAMHRIHHSSRKSETDSNYGTIFSFWDRLFGTLKEGVKQDQIVFGLKEYREPNELTLFHLLGLPFKKLFQTFNKKRRDYA